jgi:recombination protein RecT
MNTPTTIDTQKPATLRTRLESPDFAAAVAKALPKHLTPDRFIRVAVTAITRTPKLAQCDQASFFGALLTLSQFGIEPDGRRAHLIPFENRKRGVVECQLIIDYKGLAELALRSGLVSYLHADVVCDGDVFDVNMGEIKEHRVDYKQSRGKPYAAYAICKFKDGSSKAEVLTIDEVEAIRKRSRAGQAGPWMTDFSEMAKKTAFRRLAKWLPLSADVRELMDKDDDRFDEIKRVGPSATATPLNPFELPTAIESEATPAILAEDVSYKQEADE